MVENRCPVEDEELSRFLGEEYPEVSEAELLRDRVLMSILEVETFTPQQMLERRKILYFRENLRPDAKLWGLWEACFLLLDADNEAEYTEFSLMYALRQKEPQHNNPVFETFLWRFGYCANVRRYMQEAVVDCKYEERIEKPYVRPSDFLDWARRSGYSERIPDVVKEEILGALATVDNNEGITKIHCGEGMYLDRKKNAWIIAYRNKECLVPHLKGMSDIATLIAYAGKRIPAIELERNTNGREFVEGVYESVITPECWRNLKKTAHRLISEKEEAEKSENRVLAEEIDEELQAVLAEIKRAKGPSGRHKKLNPENKKLCNRVGRRILKAIDTIEQYDPDFARHLRTSIREPRSSAPYYLPPDDLDSTVLN